MKNEKDREFSDEVYEKIDKSLKAVKNGDYCTIQKFENEMEDFFKELEREFKSGKVIAENKEEYRIDRKI